MQDETRRVLRFVLIEMAELRRPQISVLCDLSGIFRDSFEHFVSLLGRVCRQATEAEEPEERNLVGKHAQHTGETDGVLNTGVRIFSNPPVDNGSMGKEEVADAMWISDDEIAENFFNRKTYVYGLGYKLIRLIEMYRSLFGQ